MPCSHHQVVTKAGKEQQGISKPGENAEVTRLDLVSHVTQLDVHILKSSPLELPLQVILTVLKHMAKRSISWHPEVIIHLLAERQVDHITQSVEIWRGAYNHAPRPQSDAEAPERRGLELEDAR